MRRARRKAANKEKVFGCDLMEHLAATNQDVPLVLRSCSEFVESHGIVDGIYRLSGVSSNIQKLRGEFESDTGPELNRELYLQDIHCVSSLCKAYFRELPNPLLTYRLYDKFAEAVALQLEDERLVKIRDVLKELPPPHYRTLEFLMRHLVHVASFSSETNMHSRNLAIVWAPNLLRSKEIEVCGFNGTAAFMEVRVQSIVVEFILTHVPQLFPEPGASSERRKSLPSPCFLTNQEEAFFKQPTMNIGNLSPGDGPLPIRPYHSIIEGPDKRKGSLKGRRWMSIFNIGGRFHETRRRHKTSTKEKDHPTLRGARSMDSLSSPSPRSDPHPSPRPPSSHLSPLAVAQPQPQPPAVSEPPAPTSPRIVSEYAVTYRRGTGQVTTGTQGTYTALDPEGPTSNDAVQTRSPGLTAKAGRRIAVHITGPTMVTVPLHITSNLALGVLQGGGGDRIIHRGSNKEVKEVEEVRQVKEMKEVRSERKGSEVEKREAADEQGSKRKSVLEVFRAPAETEEVGEGPCELEVGEGPCELEVGEGPCELEVGEGPCELEVGEGPCELEVGEGPCEREVEDTRPSNREASNSETQRKHRSREEEDMDVEKETGPDPEPDPGPDPGTEDYVFDPEDMSPEADDLNLSGYVQHNFDFLDQMDCSLMDRSCRIQEFSVEPPGNYEEEYETMDHPPTPPATPTSDAISPSRLLTADIHQRHTKSLSLPFMSSPLPDPDEPESGSESASDVSTDYEEEEEEEEHMFMQSLPSDFFLNDLTNTETQLGDNLTVYVSSVKLIEGEVSEEHALESEESDEEESEIAGESCQTKESADKDIETEAVCVLNEDECTDGKDAEVEEQNTDLMVDQDLEREEDIQAVLSQTCVVEMEEDWQCAGSETRNDSLDGSDGLESCELEVDTEEEKTTEDNLHKDTGSADKSPEPAGGSVEVRPDDEGSDEDHILYQQMNTIDTEEKCVSHNPLHEDKQEITGNHFDSTQKENRHGNGQIVPPEFDGNGIDVDNLQGQLDEEEVFEETAKRESIDDIWDELEDVVCEVIEDLETQEPNVEKSTDIEEKTWNVLDSEVNKVENQVQKDTIETDIKLKDGHYELNVANDANAKCAVEKQSQKPPTEAKPDHLQCTEIQQCPGVGSKVVTSKLPKVYCAKAVPIVPPKPQHCKLTALTLRQQQQRAPEDQRLEAEEVNVNWWKDRDESIRQSPQSMCFDEAVAIATLRRGKGRESDRDRAHTAKSDEK